MRYRWKGLDQTSWEMVWCLVLPTIVANPFFLTFFLITSILLQLFAPKIVINIVWYNRKMLWLFPFPSIQVVSFANLFTIKCNVQIASITLDVAAPNWTQTLFDIIEKYYRCSRPLAAKLWVLPTNFIQMNVCVWNAIKIPSKPSLFLVESQRSVFFYMHSYIGFLNPLLTNSTLQDLIEMQGHDSEE